jgi:CheY-like chemotaxis protein
VVCQSSIDGFEIANLPYFKRNPAFWTHQSKIDGTLASEAADPDPPPAVGSRQVLVVEDDDTAAAALARLLQSWGCSVRVARDGAEALRAAREEPPDMVFLDIRLPGMSGVEVARRLRRDAGLGRARLVAVTGEEGAADVLRSPERFARLLVKPVSASAVRDALGQPA